MAMGGTAVPFSNAVSSATPPPFPALGELSDSINSKRARIRACYRNPHFIHIFNRNVRAQGVGTREYSRAESCVPSHCRTVEPPCSAGRWKLANITGLLNKKLQYVKHIHARIINFAAKLGIHVLGLQGCCLFYKIQVELIVFLELCSFPRKRSGTFFHAFGLIAQHSFEIVI